MDIYYIHFTIYQRIFTQLCFVKNFCSIPMNTMHHTETQPDLYQEAIARFPSDLLWPLLIKKQVLYVILSAKKSVSQCLGDEHLKDQPLHGFVCKNLWSWFYIHTMFLTFCCSRPKINSPCIFHNSFQLPVHTIIYGYHMCNEPFRNIIVSWSDDMSCWNGELYGELYGGQKIDLPNTLCYCPII